MHISKHTTYPIYMILMLVVMVIGWTPLTGCSRKKVENDYLIRVKNLTLTLSDFNQAVEAASEEAFPGEKNISAEELNDLRLRVMNQSTEELIVLAFAADKGIAVTDEELEKAIEDIKADYPDNTFEETLLENAVSYPFWKKKMASRLLIKKVINQELVNQVQITSDDIAEYYKANYSQNESTGQNAEEIDQRIITHLRQQKAEKAYKEWIENLRKTYPVEINRHVWDHLIGGKS